MSSAGARRTFARRAALTNNQIFLQYYNENDVFSSLEGILKMISIVCCVVLSVVSLSGGAACARAPALAGGAAGVAVGVAAALALLVGARALQLPQRAPHAFLLTDIVSCSVCGGLAALAGALGLALCARAAAVHYVIGPVALVTAGLLIASASYTYFSAMRLWDAAAGPAREPRPPPALEHEV